MIYTKIKIKDIVLIHKLSFINIYLITYVLINGYNILIKNFIVKTIYYSIKSLFNDEY